MIITSLYAALLGLMLVWLSFAVIRLRRSIGSAIGDADNLDLKRRISAHSNFTQYTPLFLVMLAAAESTGLMALVLHGLAIAFVIGRLSHAYSMLCAESYDAAGKLTAMPKFRMAGMMLTFFPIIILSVILLYQFVTFPR